MKKILLLFFGVILITFTSFYFSKNESNGHGGRCTGSANCTACSNCSRCGHCGAGGTCGVCSGSSWGKSISSSGHSSHKKKKRSYSRAYNNSNNSSVGFYSSSRKRTPIYHYETNVSLTDENFLYTVYKSVNIRTGAGKNYPIIETVARNTKLIFLYEKSDWYKVKVVESNREGYVYKESVK